MAQMAVKMTLQMCLDGSDMLLNWFDGMFKDELKVLISSESITLQRIKYHLFKAEVMHQQRFFVENIQGEHSVEAWQGSITLLSEQLKLAKWRDTQAEVIISNHFSHYAVVPWRETIATLSEQEAYTKHLFISQFGDTAKGWHIRTATAAYGKSTLASAVSERLVQACKKLFDEAGVHLKAINPHLMVAMNQVQAETDILQNANWLVVAANGRLCIGLIEQNEWRLVKNSGLDQGVVTQEQIAQQIDRVIKRENLLFNRKAELDTLLLYTTETLQHAELSILAPQFHRIILIPTLSYEHKPNNPALNLALV